MDTPPRAMLLSLLPASSSGVLPRFGCFTIYPLRGRIPPTPTNLDYQYGPLYMILGRRIRISPGDRTWCQQPVNARYINVGINTRRCLYTLVCVCVPIYIIYMCVMCTVLVHETDVSGYRSHTKTNAATFFRMSQATRWPGDDDDDDATTDGYIRFF
jgi:hypothetical protein